MRCIFLIVLFLIAHILGSSQTLRMPSDAETTLFELNNNNQTYTIHFKLIDRPAGTKTTLKFKDLNSGTADINKDYDYPTQLKDIDIDDASKQDFDLPFRILNDDFKEQQEYFIINISYNVAGGTANEKVKITISDPNETKAPEVSLSPKNSFRVLAGRDFNFDNPSLFDHFAGEAQAFVPNFRKFKFLKKEAFVGFQFGFFTYNYYESDSSKGNLNGEQYLVDPTATDLRVDATKYVRDVNATNIKTTYINRGIYFTPMIRLLSGNAGDMYLSLHGEAILRKIQVAYSQTSLRKDTLIYNRNDSINRKVLAAFPGIRGSYSENNYFEYYLGAGFPIKGSIEKSVNYYIYPVVGLTNFSSTILQTDTLPNGKISRVSEVIDRSWKPFLAFKFQLATTVAPLDIVIGGELRAISRIRNDKNTRFLGIYLGAILPFDKLKKE